MHSDVVSVDENREDADTRLAVAAKAWEDYIDVITVEEGRPLRRQNILDIYQGFTPTTAAYPAQHAFSYLVPALVEEAGEVAGKYAKMVRKHGTADPYEIDDPAVWEEFCVNMQKEMGDLMWMISEIHNNLELDMTTTLIVNRDKLIDRQNRNTIVGEGDDR